MSGAMVRLVGPPGGPGAAFLTGTDGAYRLTAPGPGSYRLQIERIGYAEALVGPILLQDSSTLVFDIRLTPRALNLDGLSVEGDRRGCRLDTREAGEVQRAWYEARKALSAASWTERESQLRFEVAHIVRRMDRSGATVLDEARSVSRGVGANSVRSVPAETLASGGYVAADGGYLNYYGPDAATLLSDTFVETHCFGLRTDSTEAGAALGIDFEPVPGRSTPDIRGTMWLAGSSLRLDRVDFTYTGLDHLPGWELAGGEVRFLELPDGRWVVQEWRIRAPLLRVHRTQDQRGATRQRFMLEALQSFGGELLRVEDGSTLMWSSEVPSGGVRGVVWDSIAGRPLSDAGVRIAGRAWRTRTDAEGRWTLSALPPGRYSLAVEHPLLDSLGLDPGFPDVTVRSGEVATAYLAIPPLETLLGYGCEDTSGGRVVGVVTDTRGTPVPGAEVRVTAGLPEGSPLPRDSADRSGVYRLCGLSVDQEVAIEATLGPLRSGVRATTPLGGRVLRVDLPLGQGQSDVADVGLVRGRTVRLRDLQPIEGVWVELLDDGDRPVAGMLTDRDGGFLLRPGSVTGPLRIRTRHVAYRTSVSRPMTPSSRSVRLEVRMDEHAIPLDEMVVEVRRGVPNLERAGYYQRERLGLGSFLDRDDIEGQNPASARDLLARHHLMTPAPAGGSAAGQPEFFVFRRVLRTKGSCPPAVYVDGALFREGGQRGSSIDDSVPVDAIEAIELYPSEASVPAQFTGPGATCGVVVIWTR